MSLQKVYIIDPPQEIATPEPEIKRPKQAEYERLSPSPSPDPPARQATDWLLVLRAYFLGPVNLILWPRGGRRLTWAIMGAVSLVAAALLCALRDNVTLGFESRQFGAVAWSALVSIVILSVTVAWARAVSVSERATGWPKYFRASASVGALGLVFPGVGLLIAGRTWKSTCAIMNAGILIAALVILGNWQWLVEQSVAGAGVAHKGIELVLLFAVAGALFGGVAWLVQALDGARVVSPPPHSHTRTGVLALVTVVAVVVGVATFRPVAIAGNLESIAVPLKGKGLRIIPLALYEVASTLDRGTPRYLANSATLYEGIGNMEASDAKRELLQTRAARFAGAVNAQLTPIVVSETPLSARPLNAADRVYPWLLLPEHSPLLRSSHRPR